LNSAATGDVITLTTMCTGKSYTLPSRRITLRGAPGAGFDGTGAPSNLLKGTDVSTTVIKDLIFRDAAGPWDGNAIIIDGDASAPRILNSTFRNNGVTNGAGGAITVHAGTGGVVLSNNTFGGARSSAGNTAGNGAAAYLVTDGPLTVRNNVFRNNRAASEGGALWLIAQSGAPLTLSGNSFTSNVAERGGGAVYLHLQGDATVTNNVFRGNRIGPDAPGIAVRHGGALYAFINNDTATIDFTQSNNVFENNRVSQAGIEMSGGAVHYQPRTAFTLSSRNDRFVNNRVAGAGKGGAIRIDPTSLSGAVKVTLTNAVVAGNAVGDGGFGGGIQTEMDCMTVCTARLELRNSTVAANGVATASGTQLQLEGTWTLFARNSIVYGGGASDVVYGGLDAASTDMCTSPGTPAPGAGNICKNPRLKNAADGNVHQTRRSPTRDKGSNASVPSSLKTDFEGHRRILDSNNDGTKRVDMGADEMRTRSRISIEIRGTSDHLSVLGQLLPKNRGKRVIVTLSRNAGDGFKRLGRKRVRLNRRSRFEATFRRPPPGTCKAKVDFLGSATTLPGTKTKNFPC
jgi:hypothetical protein